MEFIETKTILTKEKYGDSWFGIDYKINLYRGCPHGCIYCDSRSNCYHIDNFDVPKGKENALAILENELSKRKEKGVVGIGSMSDTYNPQELKYEQTKGALELILKYNFGVSIDTKSDLILRDLNLLKKINENNNVIVKITITTPNDELSKIIEPNVCVSSKRFETIKKLSDNNIFVGILLTPVLPFITDNESDIKKLVKMAHDSGAKFIYTNMGMTLRENQREYYYKMLDKSFKGLKDKYIKYFNNNYFCMSLNAQKLYKVFKEECDKYNILYDMKDIIKSYKKEIKDNEQLSLWNN